MVVFISDCMKMIKKCEHFIKFLLKVKHAHIFHNIIITITNI